jgi:hypothetical protein
MRSDGLRAGAPGKDQKRRNEGQAEKAREACKKAKEGDKTPSPATSRQERCQGEREKE